jgi:hypothetical protein
MKPIPMAAALLLVAWAGCSTEFEMRKDPDLLRVSPNEARHLSPASPEELTTFATHGLDRTGWQIHTSLTNREALTDADPSTFATSMDDHRISEWILIDLGGEQRIRTVEQSHPPEGGQPPRFRIDTADAHGFPYRLQYVGSGTPGQTVAVFPRAVSARFVRITVIEDSSDPWLVSDLGISH